MPVQTENKIGYIQFITCYQHLDGFKKIRVTTISRKYVNR